MYKKNAALSLNVKCKSVQLCCLQENEEKIVRKKDEMNEIEVEEAQ